LGELVGEMSAAALVDRRKMMPFDPARAAIVVGGLVILEAVAAEAPGQRVTVSRGGLREGVLLERAGATTVRVG
jgi:exopolyphosphatase/pppGpp-phosphohydrolase